MKSVIKWATNNSPAMNTLMVTVLIVGTACLANLRREVFPEFELEIILVTVPYPGATPDEVEAHVREQLEIWKPYDGFVFQQVHNILNDVPVENILRLFSTLDRYR